MYVARNVSLMPACVGESIAKIG